MDNVVCVFSQQNGICHLEGVCATPSVADAFMAQLRKDWDKEDGPCPFYYKEVRVVQKVWR